MCGRCSFSGPQHCLITSYLLTTKCKQKQNELDGRATEQTLTMQVTHAGLKRAVENDSTAGKAEYWLCFINGTASSSWSTITMKCVFFLFFFFLSFFSFLFLSVFFLFFFFLSFFFSFSFCLFFLFFLSVFFLFFKGQGVGQGGQGLCFDLVLQLKFHISAQHREKRFNS